MAARFSRWFGRSIKALLSPVARLVESPSPRRREPPSPQRQLALLQADYSALQRNLDAMERTFQRERQAMLNQQQQLQQGQADLQAQVDDLSSLVDELMEMVTDMEPPPPSAPAVVEVAMPAPPPAAAATAPPAEVDPDPVPTTAASPIADLSAMKLALVGGHDATRRGVIRDLTRRYGLKKWVELPPSDKGSLGRNNMKAKLRDCDLIVLITRYMSHKQTDSVTKLQQAGALSGDVLPLDCRGKSGVLREILAHLNRGNA